MENNEDSSKKEITVVSLEGPLTLWIGLLVMAALLQLVAIPIANARGHTDFNSYFDQFANYVIYMPGIIVLPLVVSLWVGERVSFLGNKKSFVAYKGLANALYMVMVYVISVLIIYIIMFNQKVGVLSSMSPQVFVEYLILVPVSISVIIVPLFAVLSAARRYG